MLFFFLRCEYVLPLFFFFYRIFFSVRRVWIDGISICGITGLMLLFSSFTFVTCSIFNDENESIEHYLCHVLVFAAFSSNVLNNKISLGLVLFHFHFHFDFVTVPIPQSLLVNAVGNLSEMIIGLIILIGIDGATVFFFFRWNSFSLRRKKKKKEQNDCHCI